MQGEISAKMKLIKHDELTPPEFLQDALWRICKAYALYESRTTGGVAPWKDGAREALTAAVSEVEFMVKILKVKLEELK
jgi:hypothetical protein